MTHLHRPILLWLFFFITLSGCSDHTSMGLWQDYQQRIGNVFNVSPTSQNMTPLVIAMPSKKQRQQLLSPPNISLLQFLKLQQCAINSLVAKRNGPLGKVMLPSQTLIYISEFIPLAKQCLDSKNLNQKNTQALKQAIAFYQSNKHHYFTNGLFHDEFTTLFHSAHLWPMGEHFSPSGVSALQYWQTLHSQMQHDAWPTARIDAATLETSLHQLQQGQQVGHWLQEIHLASQVLANLTEQMNNHKGLCVYSQTSVKKTALLNVFRLWFSQQIQPWISQLNRFGQAINDQLAPLMTSPAVMQSFYQNLFLSPSGPWPRFQTQWHNHVLAWQRHLNQCQSMPGQSD